MSNDTSDLEKGQIAFDVAKQSLVEVVDTEMGTVRDQKAAMRDLIYQADGNKAVGVTDDTECVEVKYIGVDQGGRTYTMPATRIRRTDALIEAAKQLTQDAGIERDVHTAYIDATDTDLSDYE